MFTKYLKASVICFSCIVVIGLQGCSSEKTIRLVNTQEFAPDDFNEITLDYDNDSITILKGDSNKVILKEYMSKDKKAYYARLSEKNKTLSISEGRRPKFGDFTAKIEVIIPIDYKNSMSFHTTNAEIISEEDVFISTFKADTTRGKIKLQMLSATNISLSTTNGEVYGKDIISETMDVNLSGGMASMERISTGGTFKASSDGELSLSFSDVTSDLYVYAKNSDIKLSLPNDLSYKLKAESKNGVVKTNLSSGLSESDGLVQGSVGDSPDIAIEANARNGNIEITNH
nr:DUF4097 family beta strand repeat-containing protein [uncultured Blautia sp.]